jgi:hypothetical protein
MARFPYWGRKELNLAHHSNNDDNTISKIIWSFSKEYCDKIQTIKSWISEGDNCE